MHMDAYRFTRVYEHRSLTCVGSSPKRRASLEPRSSTLASHRFVDCSRHSRGNIIGNRLLTETIAQTTLRFVVDWLYNNKKTLS